MTRKKISQQKMTDILVKSKRICALCFGLSQSNKSCQGQIAHLDKNPSNNDIDNLCWLCLNHHDSFDSRTSQSKNYTKQEIKTYRERLYAHNLVQHNNGQNTGTIWEISTHDLGIFNQLDTIIASNYCAHLRLNFTGDSTTGELLEPFYAFVDKCNDPAFMFQDNNFEARKQSLHDKAEKMLRYIGKYLEPVGSQGYRIGPTEGSLGCDLKQMEYWSEIIDKSWDLISDFCADFEELVREKIRNS